MHDINKHFGFYLLSFNMSDYKSELSLINDCDLLSNSYNLSQANTKLKLHVTQLYKNIQNYNYDNSKFFNTAKNLKLHKQHSNGYITSKNLTFTNCATKLNTTITKVKKNLNNFENCKNDNLNHLLFLKNKSISNISDTFQTNENVIKNGFSKSLNCNLNSNENKMYNELVSNNLKNASKQNSNLGINSKEAIKLHGQKLSLFERLEILNYPSVFYIGCCLKKRSNFNNSLFNNGFDDKNGSYINILHDHISYRYEVLKLLGKGSFGQVLKVYDHKTSEYVALKMIRNEKRFSDQAVEEIKILELLKCRDFDDTRNVVHLIEHFKFRNHVCITFELLSLNLYELIKRNKFQGFPLLLVRKFAYSILICLDLLHKNKIIHCDLKPENILLKQQGRSSIKVIDFGSSCFEKQRIYTYIQSRFYRAPEVILGSTYSYPIDIWSFGCILAELVTGMHVNILKLFCIYFYLNICIYYIFIIMFVKINVL